MANEYKIFISHSWDYSDDLLKLRTLLYERGYFNVEFKEVTKLDPINSESAPYIKRKLREKINSSNIVIVLAGMYASHSEWMQWELDTAVEVKKPIIAVVPRGRERVSEVASKVSREIVAWNTESIVSAIRRHAIK